MYNESNPIDFDKALDAHFGFPTNGLGFGPWAFEQLLCDPQLFTDPWAVEDSRLRAHQLHLHLPIPKRFRLFSYFKFVSWTESKEQCLIYQAIMNDLWVIAADVIRNLLQQPELREK